MDPNGGTVRRLRRRAEAELGSGGGQRRLRLRLRRQATPDTEHAVRAATLRPGPALDASLMHGLGQLRVVRGGWGQVCVWVVGGESEGVRGQQSVVVALVLRRLRRQFVGGRILVYVSDV